MAVSPPSPLCVLLFYGAGIIRSPLQQAPSSLFMKHFIGDFFFFLTKSVKLKGRLFPPHLFPSRAGVFRLIRDFFPPPSKELVPAR